MELIMTFIAGHPALIWAAVPLSQILVLVLTGIERRILAASAYVASLALTAVACAVLLPAEGCAGDAFLTGALALASAFAVRLLSALALCLTTVVLFLALGTDKRPLPGEDM